MITTKLQETDYLHAQALHRSWSRKKFLIVSGVAIVTAALGWILWVQGYGPIAGGLLGGLIGGAITGSAIRYLYVPWKTRKVFRQQKSLQREFTLSWSEDCLLSEDANGQYKTAWADFTNWKEDAHIFLLYHSDIAFQMLPKRAFSNANVIAEFRSHIQRVIHV